MSSEIKIHILHTGYVRVDEAVPFGGQIKSINPIAYTGFFRSKKHQVWLPVSCYLIEHPKGKVLVDTGWHTDMRTKSRAHLGVLHYKINRGQLPEGKAIHEQLAFYGIHPEGLDYVVLSHLDSDHVSGLQQVKNAKKILVSEEEWRIAKKNKLRYLSAMWKGVNVETFAYKNEKIGPKNKVFDLFGDGKILFTHAPGHTAGLSATIINNNGKFVLLASDIGYATKSWEQMILPGVIVNKKDALESLAWVKKMAADPNCIAAIANHEVALKPHTIII